MVRWSAFPDHKDWNTILQYDQHASAREGRYGLVMSSGEDASLMRQTRVQYPGATLGGQAGQYHTPAVKGMSYSRVWSVNTLSQHATARFKFSPIQCRSSTGPCRSSMLHTELATLATLPRGCKLVAGASCAEVSVHHFCP